MRVILLVIALLFLTACDMSPFLGNTPQNPQPVENGTNVTEVEPVNVTEANTTTETVPVTNLYRPFSKNLSIYVMDVVGQSIIILKSGKSLLLDAGTEDDSKIILQNLRNLGITELDNVILTNPTEENLGGLPYIIIQTSPAIVYDTGRASQSSNYQFYKELYPNNTLVPTDKLFLIDNMFVKLIVLYDDEKGFLEDVKDNSIITKLTYKLNDFLFMSNCGFQCLERIKDENVNADVLVIDGSCDSTTLTFIQKVSPKVVVATEELCPETKDRFEFLDIPLYYKEKHGDIRIISNGENIELNFLKVE